MLSLVPLKGRANLIAVYITPYFPRVGDDELMMNIRSPQFTQICIKRRVGQIRVRIFEWRAIPPLVHSVKIIVVLLRDLKISLHGIHCKPPFRSCQIMFTCESTIITFCWPKKQSIHLGKSCVNVRRLFQSHEG